MLKLGVSLILVTLCLAMSGTGRANDVAMTGPSAVVNAFHAALDRGDKDAALALLAGNVQIYEQGYVERSKAEYASHHLASDMEFSQAVKSETNDVAVVDEGNLAYVISQGTTKGEFKGKPVDTINLETMVLSQVDGSWKIVHIHWSLRKVEKK